MNSSADESKSPVSALASAQRGRFPIAGIGASAGGLDAITELVRNLPPDIEMSFVLVQHLDPGHESALTQIVQQRYEDAHESLQAFNEEIQSGNEELQSINEELHGRSSLLADGFY
jgi:chemotaxis response regulator CheB